MQPHSSREVEKNWWEWVMEGDACFEARRFSEAVVVYSNSIQLYPNTEGYLRRSIAYSKLGEYYAASADHNFAVQLHPRNRWFFGRQDTPPDELEEYQRALVELEHRIQSGQTSPFAYIVKSMVYMFLEEYHNALTDSEYAVQLAPHSVIAYSCRADAYFSLKEYEKALANYNHIIQLAPKLFSAFLGRGRCHHDLEHYQQAITDYTRAIRLAPNCASAYFHRGLAYHYLKDDKKSLADYDHVIQLAPKHGLAYYHRGLVYSSAEKHQQAIINYDHAIRFAPGFIQAYQSRGNLYYELGGYQEALADYDQILSRDYDFRGSTSRGIISAKREKAQRALEAKKKGLTLYIGTSWWEAGGQYCPYCSRLLLEPTLMNNTTLRCEHCCTLMLLPFSTHYGDIVKKRQGKCPHCRQFNRSFKEVEDKFVCNQCGRSFEVNKYALAHPESAALSLKDKNLHQEKGEPALGSIEVLTGPLAGHLIRIMRPHISIGSGPHNDIVIPDPSLSPQHAEIFWRNDSWNWSINKLLPQDSVTVNGLNVQRVVIEDDDEIGLGPISENDDETTGGSSTFRFWGRTDKRNITEFNIMPSLPQEPGELSSAPELPKTPNRYFLDFKDLSSIVFKKERRSLLETPIAQMIKEHQLREERLVKEHQLREERLIKLQRLKQEGQDYFEARRFMEAVAAYDQIIQLAPEDADTYDFRGRAFYILQEYHRAIADYDRAIQLERVRPEIFYNRGHAYYDLKEYQRAIASYAQAIELDSRFANAYFSRGWVYHELKEYQRALTDYEQAVQIDPNNALFYFGRGRVYYDLKEYQKAISDYDHTLAIDPNFAQAKIEKDLIREALTQNRAPVE